MHKGSLRNKDPVVVLHLRKRVVGFDVPKVDPNQTAFSWW